MSADASPYDCTRAREELDAFVRGDMPLEEADRMRVHLTRCGSCADVTRFAQAYCERLRRAGTSGCCPEKLRDKIKEMLEHPTGDA